MSNNHGRPNRSQSGLLPFIIATYTGNSATIRRNRDQTQTIGLIKMAFEGLRSIPADDIRIFAKFPGYTQNVRITQDIWADLMPTLKEVTVSVVQTSQAMVPRVWSTGFTIEATSGETFRIYASINDTVYFIKCKIQEQQGSPPDEQWLSYAGEPLEDELTLSDYMIPQGATLLLDLEDPLFGKKPVIYLFPPIPTADIRVELSLVKEWDFSVLYPSTAVHQAIDGGHSIIWTVDAKPDGTLLEHGTHREVSYLFWEARTKRAPLPSPACSRPSSPVPGAIESFNPARPNITPANSIVLPIDKVAGYIDDALLALGLHTEARCSFITFWLPDFQRHQYISLRFLPQVGYEAAAPMSVIPTPDVMTRVFMLFRGIKEAELELWDDAGAFIDPSSWQEVVGVDAEKAKDMKLFRVLEWGGMEVK